MPSTIRETKVPVIDVFNCTWQKSALPDMVYLQQDAFDPVDVSMPIERQMESISRLTDVIDREYPFND